VPLLLTAAALSAPVLLNSGYVLAGAGLRIFFAAACHQDPARSFSLFGLPLAVCARCLGIYGGAVTGFLLRAQRRTAVQALVWLGLINLGSVVAEMAGIPVSNTARFVMGCGLGVAASGLLSLEPRIPSSISDQA